MVQSDALSRRPDLCPEIDTNNEDQTLLPETMFVNTIDTDLRDLIAEARGVDHVVLDAVEALRTGGIPPMKTALSNWRLDGDLVFYRDQCYVPNNLDL
jgi:hypothetical protein